MRIKELSSNDWRVYSPVVDSGNFTDIESYINENINDKAVHKVLASIERLSTHGTRGFTDSMIHEVDKTHKIFQLRKGDHRLLFFHGAERKLILMACPHRKSGRKVNAKQVDAAIKIKHQYEKSYNAGSIVYCKD